MYKKLAVVVDTFPRWSERFIARELQALRRAGVALTVFCLKTSEQFDADEEWAGLREHTVRLPHCITPRLGSGSRDPEIQRREKLALKALGLRFAPKLKCADAFRGMLHDGGFEHLHAHFASLPSTLAWVAGAGLNLPFSISVHARDLFVEAQLLAEKAADSARIFCCHKRAAETLASHGLAAKTVLMHHGIPLAQFPFTASAALARPVKLLAAGRLVPKKGFEILIDACAAPELSRLNFELTIVGEGPQQARLERRIASLKLGPKVLLEQPVAGAALRQYFRSDALIAPYVDADDGDADGIPNVLLEAFAVGLPVIGTGAGSLREVLSVQTGNIVPQRDPAALAAAIAGFIAQPELARPKLHTARKLVEERFDSERNIAPLLDLLRA